MPQQPDDPHAHGHARGAIRITAPGPQEPYVGAYCQGFEKFDSDEERLRAVEKLTRKHKTLVQSAAAMASPGVECDLGLLQISIAHRSACQDQALAERQAAWLADKFVWDHVQENSHQSSIQLPGSREIEVIGAGAPAQFLRQHPPGNTTAEHENDAREASAV